MGIPSRVKHPPFVLLKRRLPVPIPKATNTERECVGGPGDDDQSDLPELW